jgi:hypothetical protein
LDLPQKNIDVSKVSSKGKSQGQEILNEMKGDVGDDGSRIFKGKIL